LAGVEALARWEHPVHGLLGPEAFLAAVEQTSLMRAFTDELIRQALRSSRAWRAAGLEIPIAVNLAAANLLDAGLPGGSSACSTRPAPVPTSCSSR
jgi:EAL domain-containing protein (putative c-di-GMP-specific phosphodiesterase class I)